MSDRPVHLSSGLPQTVLDPEPSSVTSALRDAALLVDDQRRTQIAAVVAANPRSLSAWADLGDVGRDTIERYAAYRIGYHRGLDKLRASGWRGSGYVRWKHETNRPFLRCLDGLREMAAAIGESDEVDRCDLFLHQLDPEWDRRS